MNREPCTPGLLRFDASGPGLRRRGRKQSDLSLLGLGPEASARVASPGCPILSCGDDDRATRDTRSQVGDTNRLAALDNGSQQ